MGKLGKFWTMRRIGAVRCIASVIGGACLGLLACTAPVLAQYNASYVTSFPPGDAYRIMVIGDSLAEGLVEGLKEEISKETSVQLLSKTRWGVGLTRGGKSDVLDDAKEATADSDFQIAIVMFGVNDRRWMRDDGDRVKFGTDEWKNLYSGQVDDVLKELEKEKAAIYWVGLPIMRGDDRNEEIRVLNTIFRERAFRQSVRYIDTWSAAADAEGDYNEYGPDLEGRMRRLRDNDGIHFTGRGYAKLAHFVAKDVLRDISIARTQRDVPLAGDSQEQGRIVARLRQWDTTQRADTEQRGLGDVTRPRKAFGDLPEYKDDTTRIVLPVNADLAAAIETGNIEASKQELNIELVRPAIPSAVVQHIQRRSASANNAIAAPPLEFNLATGETLLGQVTPEEEWSDDSRRRLPVTQTPYYKVLVKGERLTPKHNRADDISWPRQGLQPARPAG